MGLLKSSAGEPSRTARLVRLLLILILGAILAGFLIGTTLYLSPDLQRRVTLALFPSGPETSLDVQELAAGIRGVRVRNLRLVWRGLRVSIDAADLRIRPISLVSSGALEVEDLKVTGLVADFRAGSGAGKAAPSTPYRFAGLRPFVSLPIRMIVRQADVAGRILIPSALEANNYALDLHVRGRDVAPEKTGQLQATVALNFESPSDSKKILAGEGTLAVHEDRDALLDRIEFQGLARPGTNRAGDAGLAQKLTFDLSKPEEAYSFALATTGSAARNVLSIAIRYAPTESSITGTWQAHLDRGQLEPYLRGSVPPEFALQGEGKLAIAIGSKQLDLQGTFDATASQWEALHPALARLGSLRFRGEAAVRIAGSRIGVNKLTVAGGPVDRQAVAEIGADQPFQIAFSPLRLTPTQQDAPLLHAQLSQLPLYLLGPGVGGTIDGAVTLTQEKVGVLRIDSTAPLESKSLILTSRERGAYGPVHLTTVPSIRLLPDRVEGAFKDCRVILPGGARIDFAGSVNLPRDGQWIAALQGKVVARLPRITALEKNLDTLGADGHFVLDIPNVRLDVASASLRVSDPKGQALATGEVATVRPLRIDLRTGWTDWSQFEPSTLAVHFDGFPIAWASAYLPQVRIGSGRLYGHLTAALTPGPAPGREVRITSRNPFEIRDASLFLGDLPIVSGAHFSLMPSIRLTHQQAIAELTRIDYHDENGNEFSGDVRLEAKPQRGTPIGVTASLALLAPSVTQRVGNLGEFRLHTKAMLDLTAHRLDVDEASFDCRDGEGRSYFTGENVAPFAVLRDPLRFEPRGASPELFRATFLPLEIERLFPQALGFSLTGKLPSGKASITTEDGGLFLNTSEPLQFGPISVSRNGQPVLDGVQFSFEPEFSYGAAGAASRATRIGISAQGKTIASITLGGRFDVIGANPTRTVNTTVHVDLPALFRQPLGRAYAGFESGAMDIESMQVLTPPRKGSTRIDITGVVPIGDSKLPDLSIHSKRDTGADGSVAFELPLRLTSPGRDSDLTAHGVLRPDSGGWRLDGNIDSERLILDDIARWSAALLPRAEATPTGGKVAPAPAARPSLATILAAAPGKAFWYGYRGHLPIHLKSIELDRYAAKDATVTLDLEDDAFRLQELKAPLLGTVLKGDVALRFKRAAGEAESAAPLGKPARRSGQPQSSAAAPGEQYLLDASLGGEGFDVGRLFTSVNSSQPPVLDGKFKVAFLLSGAGADPAEALSEAHATIDLAGTDGMFRGLGMGLESLGFLARAAGVLTFSAPLRAAGRSLGTLKALPIQRASLKFVRDPAIGLTLQSSELASPDLIVRAAGTIQRVKELPFVDRPLDFKVELASKGDIAILFDGVQFLGPQADAQGYRPVTRTFVMTGTLANPDASQMYRVLDEGISNAKGSFGYALRKARKMFPPTPVEEK